MLSAQTLPKEVSKFQHVTKLIDDKATLGKRDRERKKKGEKETKADRQRDEDSRTHSTP
jgi:hypothetical protein